VAVQAKSLKNTLTNEVGFNIYHAVYRRKEGAECDENQSEWAYILHLLL
jgi:hypothetical protein